MSAYSAWFDIAFQPVHEGVYEVTAKTKGDASFPLWALWKDGQWHLTSDKLHEAALQTERSWDCHNGNIKRWRGLANEP